MANFIVAVILIVVVGAAIAYIVKEKKKTIGMVTMKDVLEELVDNIDEKGTSDGDNND